MQRSLIETILGGVVLLIAGMFIIFAYNSSNTRSSGGGGYTLSANFSKVDGVTVGTDVKVSGIKVGRVSALDLDPATFLAKLTIEIGDSIKLPKDSVIAISSDGLLGGNYVSITPGGDPDLLAAGDSFSYAQAPTSLTELLARFVFSASSSTPGAPKDAAAPATPN